MKMAAITPNSATKAGNSMDCDIAAANGACSTAGRCATSAGISPGGMEPPGPEGISVVIRDDMKAAILALPRTEPTWRVVL